MIQEIIVFIIILIISMIVQKMIRKDILGPFYPIALRLSFIGVIVHELSHYVLNLAVGIIPKKIEIKWKSDDKKRRSPQGAVYSKPRSLLQAFFICLAPLYISTWLAFLTLYIALSANFNPVIRVVSGLICISLVLGAAPSNQDFNNIPNAFRKDPIHSLYQIFLVILSSLILWIIIQFSQIIFLLDVFYYFTIIGIYFILKFIFIGSRDLIHKVQSLNYRKPPKVRIKPFTRKHYKPKKPHTEW